MKNFVRTTDINRQARIFLAANIVFIYFLTVVAVALSIEHFNAKLFSGEYYKSPNILLLTIWFLYYGAPVLLAFVFAWFFRPFWRSFRNLIFTILAIQFLYSFTVCMLRWDYLRKFQKENSWRKSDKMKLLDLAPKHYDRNEDGFIEEIGVSPAFDFTKTRPGEYVLHAAIVPGGGLSPFLVDGGGTFTIAERGSKNKIRKDFVITLRPELGSNLALFEEKNFQVKFMVFRVATVDNKGKTILRFNRWAPFLRSTGWQGSDSQIYEDMILLDNMTAPDVFILRAPPDVNPGT